MPNFRRFASRAALALAAALAAAAPAAAQELVFSVTEGVTYQATPREIRDKFEPLAEVIGKALRRNVKVVLVPAYDDARAGLARQEYDLAFIHPAHVAMAEIKNGRYRAIAWTGGYTEYTVSLLAKPDRPFKDLGDVKGRTLVTPDPDSITAVMVRAMLRSDHIGGRNICQWCDRHLGTIRSVFLKRVALRIAAVNINIRIRWPKAILQR